MSALDDVAASIAEHRRNAWYYQRFLAHNPNLAPAVVAYLDGGPRPDEALIGENRYAWGLVRAEDARRKLAPPPSVELPVTRTVLDPGEHAAWTVGQSPTTQVAGPPGDQYGRIIAWDPVDYSTHADDTGPGIYRPPNRCYTLSGFRLIEGNPGRGFDYHSSPFGGSWGGVAPLAIDYFGAPGSRDPGGLMLTVQPEDWTPSDPGGGRYHFQIATQAEMEARRGQWVWLWLEIVWGRSDGPVDGSLRAWLAGEDTPRVNVTGINTYWPGMRHVSLWEGAYWSNGAPSKVVVDLALTRVGRTPRECYLDQPSIRGRWGAGARPGTSEAAGSIDGAVAVPSELRW